MQLIDKKLDLELSAFICGWHQLEKKLGAEDVIDMNVSNKVKGKEYNYRLDVYNDIENFMAINEIKNNDLIYRKLNSHKHFIQNLMGAVIPFDYYLENTMGIKPVIYSDKKIQTLRDNTNALLEPYGLKVQENVSEDLNNLDVEVPVEEFVKFFDDHHHGLYSQIKDKTGIDVDFNVKYKQIDKQEPRIAEILGNGKNYNVLFNMYHMKNNRTSALKHLSAHEISAHAVHFAALRKKYNEGKMPRFLTYIATHEPLLFGAEGMAETIQDFFPDNFQTPLMKATFSLNRLRRAVSNNATTWANRGENLIDCVNYIYENAPNFPKGKVAHMLGYSINKPSGSSYSQVYSQGMETYKEISQSHNDKHAFIKSSYEDFLMPDQIQALIKTPIIDFV